jgi:hypothetical protein
MAKKNEHVNLNSGAVVLPERKTDPSWIGKSGEELAKEQGILPVQDEKDFARQFSGGQENWTDMEDFLRYFHGH